MYLILINILCLLDMFMKYLFVRKCIIYESKIISIYLQPVHNYGFGLGIHKNSRSSSKIIMHIAVIIIVSMLYYLTKNIYMLTILFASFYNLLDRIRFGYIIDYINFNLFRNIYILTFNLIDFIIIINLMLYFNPFWIISLINYINLTN